MAKSVQIHMIPDLVNDVADKYNPLKRFRWFLIVLLLSGAYQHYLQFVFLRIIVALFLEYFYTVM